MKFSTELIVVIVAIIIFYLRIAQLRGKKKRYEREFALKRRKVNGRSKGSPLPQQPAGAAPYVVKSWILVGVSVILMTFGLLLYNQMAILGFTLVKDQALVDAYKLFWYIPVSLGVLLLAFCITITKPNLDE